MLLSILVPGKNDNFRRSNTKVIKFNLHQIIQNIKDTGVDDVELVLCDWGSEKRIVDEIITEKHPNFKCVYVPPEIAQKYNGDWSYSIVHPINTAFRKSSGKYVIFWDSDCFQTLESFKNLYTFVKSMDQNNDLKFYWGSRSNVPYSKYFSFEEPNELVNYLNTKPQLETDLMYNDGRHPGVEINAFIGFGISILMNRTLWQSSTGWFEELPYWGVQDIEFHNRLLTKYQYGGDLSQFGIDFYHLLPSETTLFDEHKHPNMKQNPIHWSEKFEANPPNWGLANEILEII